MDCVFRRFDHEFHFKFRSGSGCSSVAGVNGPAMSLSRFPSVPDAIHVGEEWFQMRGLEVAAAAVDD